MTFRTRGRRVRHAHVARRAGLLGAVLLAVGFAAQLPAPLAAQQPAASPSPKFVQPKECPPPEGFRAVLHLLDNDAPMLQMYPLPGMPMPTNMFAPFGPDMLPKCALERTYDDLHQFKTEYARLGDLDPKAALNAKLLITLGHLSHHGLKRWEWCLLLWYSKYKEYDYDGRTIPELKENMDAVYSIAIESGKKFVEAMTVYLDRFKGVENDAVDAKKRLDEDAARAKPRPAKDIAKDQAKVADYERRFKENGELMELTRTLRDCYKMISRTHHLQQWCWPATGDPALTLAQSIISLDTLNKRIRSGK